MKITMEQVEKLREKANVTYDDAKSALEAVGGDMLDALIYLERHGKVVPPKNNGFYQSETVLPENIVEKTDGKKTGNEAESGGQTFSQLIRKFINWCGVLIGRGNANSFEAWKSGKSIVSLPITALVLLLIFTFWFILPLLILGLFFGFRYMFKGPDFGRDNVNDFMNSAANAAENIKKEVTEEFRDKGDVS